MTALTALTLAQARDGLAKKTFSAVELADAHLAAMEKARLAVENSLNAVTARAYALAKQSDQQASDAPLAL